MRHVPGESDAIEIKEISYQSLTPPPEEAKSADQKNTYSVKKILAYIGAFAPKIGDVSTNVFNYLKIKELLFSFIGAFIATGDSAWLYGAIALALYLAINSWLNDSLLFNPAEERVNIEKLLTWEKPVKSLSINDDNLPLQTKTSQSRGSVVNYLSYAILSASGATGMLIIFPESIAGKIFGAFFAALGTALGILYSYMVFANRPAEFDNLLRYFRSHPCYCLQKIWENRAISAQIAKCIFLILLYYTSMGIFYSYSLSKTLAMVFGFSINSRALNIAMGIAGALVFFNSISLRFPSTLKRYFYIPILVQAELNPLLKFLINDAGYSRTQRKIDCTQELLINGAGLAFSARRLLSNPTLAIAGISISMISLLTGLRAIFSLPISETRSSSPSKFYFLTHWLNGHSRFIKSLFLPFAAILNINDLLKTHSNIDLGLDGWDILCLTIILGVLIGMNSSLMYKKSIDGQLKYLNEKMRIDSEDRPAFGKLGFFYAAEDYPEPHRDTLTAIMNSGKKTPTDQRLIYEM